jgi:hypothetical protein
VPKAGLLSLKKRGCQISQKNWIFNDQSHKKRLSRWLRPRKPLGIQSACIFGNLYVKEAIEVIEAVEVIMADGANEAIEVIRFI